MGLDELRRRLLTGQSDPQAAASETAVYVSPTQGIVRGPSNEQEARVLSEVPKKIFAA